MARLSATIACAGMTLLGATASAQESDADLRSAARDSYIFTYPLVMMYRTMYLQAVDRSSPSFGGGMGEWLHLGVATPADTDIVTPHNDTPYSYAWVDLRAEPWVLTLPRIEADRFYTSQWDDLWGYVLDNAGSVNDGNGGVSVLLAGPTWNGALPEGVDRIIRGESWFLGTLTRTQLVGDGGMDAVQDIQARYVLEPLSAFLDEGASPPAASVDWLPWQEGDETRPVYWDHVARLLPLIEPRPEDAGSYAKLETLGITRGAVVDRAALPPIVQDALAQGIADGRALLAQEATALTDGTKLFGPRETVGQNYLDRALGVFVGIFGNTKDISVYLNRVVDETGAPLDGSETSYEMTFPPGALPPVDFFWSMTMYRMPERLLVENPIRRYSIGSATPGLTYAEDGSLTLYISADSPGAEREANWLPAPEGPFWMVMRNYGPGDSILDRSYELPPVRVTE